MKENDIILAQPAIESLMLRLEGSNWPNWIKGDQNIKTESKLRLDLYQQLDSLFNNGYSSSDMTTVYNTLSDFIEASNFNQRLILYLPTEIIPENSINPELAVCRFKTIYLKSWHNLLSNHELRASFLDGDTEQSDMVSKAAHLIPILLKKGLISFQEIINLFKNSSDKILGDSILDTIHTIFELGLISQDELTLLSTSDNSELRNIAIIINNDVRRERELTIIKDQTDLKELLIEINQKIVEKNKLIKSQTDKLDRINWLRRKEQKIILKKHAEVIYTSITNKNLSINCFKKFLVSQVDEVSIILGIYVLGKIKSDKVSHQFKPWLMEVFQKSDLIFRATESTLSYWFSWGVISKKYLESFCLKPKKIDANFSIQKTLPHEELIELVELTKLIKKDVELSKYLYPIFIIYGSRIKGYASLETDIDLAVFVRPEADSKKLSYLEELLQRLIKHEKIKGQIFKFCLQRNNDLLSINNNLSYQKNIGNSDCVHVLLGGAWLGDSEIIRKLHAEILINYLTAESKDYWLQELERDFLQYRLMHDGYASFFPERKILDTNHSYELDTDSSFWDEGYREIATKLFVKKIFLPKILTK
jgi:predicted nucleotidyltransferase